MKQPNQGDRRQLCHDLEALKERCFRSGLFLTAQLLNKASQQIGYECAEQFEREDRAAKKRKG